MINELLIKYKDQKPKNFGDYVERSYPVSAVIAMLEEVQQNFCKPDVSGRSEQLPLAALEDCLNNLTDDQRLNLIGNYCHGCGSTDKNCQCWKDD